MTSVTIQRFHEDIEAAERASDLGPVIITHEGAATRVLMDIEQYRRILHMRMIEGIATDHDYSNFQQAGGTQDAPRTPGTRTLADLCAVPEDEYFEWEPERLYLTSRPVDFD